MAVGTASAATPEPTPVPLTISANAIPGQYIVTLEPGYDPAKVAERLSLKPKFLYTRAMNGFAVPMTKLQLDIARVSLGVKSVEADAKVSAPSGAPTTATALRGPSASWGLDRIDQKELPLDNTFTNQGNGAGVTAYVLDTGIDYKHDEFGGRATFGFDAIKDGRDGQDCNGHGTHVAGTIAGKTYGVARKASVVSVRVLNCEGTGDFSGIIAGLDWVAKNAKQPAVLNGSVRTGRFDHSLSRALQKVRGDAGPERRRSGPAPVAGQGAGSERDAGDVRAAAVDSPFSTYRRRSVRHGERGFSARTAVHSLLVRAPPLTRTPGSSAFGTTAGPARSGRSPRAGRGPRSARPRGASRRRCRRSGGRCRGR